MSAAIPHSLNPRAKHPDPRITILYKKQSDVSDRKALLKFCRAQLRCRRLTMGQQHDGSCQMPNVHTNQVARPEQRYSLSFWESHRHARPC